MAEQDDSDRYLAALRGELDESATAADAELSVARRLGELLRRRYDAHLRTDGLAQRRGWNLLAQRVRAQARHAYLPFAQAAAVCALGILVGWWLPRSGMQERSERLEFTFGDYERIRGELVTVRVTTGDPLAAMQSLTDALARDGIGFEVYSVGAGSARRVLVTLPSTVPADTRASIAALDISLNAGRAYAILFEEIER